MRGSHPPHMDAMPAKKLSGTSDNRDREIYRAASATYAWNPATEPCSRAVCRPHIFSIPALGLKSDHLGSYQDLIQMALRCIGTRTLVGAYHAHIFHFGN